MGTNDLTEKLSEKVHDAWMKEKAAQGFHAPNDCPNMGKLSTAMCEKCHTDMYPYEELPENIKDYDRVTVNAVLQALDDLGIKLKESTQKTGLNFGQALDRLKQGYKVARSGWNGKGMVIVYQKGYPQGIPCNAQTAKAWGMSEGDLFKCEPYLQMKIATGSHSMYTPNTLDVLAEDWEVVD